MCHVCVQLNVHRTFVSVRIYCCILNYIQRYFSHMYIKIYTEVSNDLLIL